MKACCWSSTQASERRRNEIALSISETANLLGFTENGLTKRKYSQDMKNTISEHTTRQSTLEAADRATPAGDLWVRNRKLRLQFAPMLDDTQLGKRCLVWWVSISAVTSDSVAKSLLMLQFSCILFLIFNCTVFLFHAVEQWRWTELMDGSAAL